MLKLTRTFVFQIQTQQQCDHSWELYVIQFTWHERWPTHSISSLQRHLEWNMCRLVYCSVWNEVVTESWKPPICSKVKKQINYPRWKKKKTHQVKGNWFKSSPKHRGLLLIQRSKLWGWLEESSLLSTLDPGPRHQDMYSRKTLIFKGQKISEHFLFLKFVLSLFISKYFKAYLCVWLTSTIQLLMT